MWSVLTDPTRIAEWRSECRSGNWLNGVTEPAVGARFIGRSRVRWVRWSRPCRVLELDAQHRYRYETISPTDYTRWAFSSNRKDPRPESGNPSR
ncbi:SRPBCC family protein [Kribbella steppae]|uniref:SRPBCC family protein n=1 Tax=Kribbella steppae TaxID=2512223 RepID=UPI00104E7E04